MSCRVDGVLDVDGSNISVCCCVHPCEELRRLSVTSPNGFDIDLRRFFNSSENDVSPLICNEMIVRP